MAPARTVRGIGGTTEIVKEILGPEAGAVTRQGLIPGTDHPCTSR